MALQQTSIRYHHDDVYPHFYLCNYLPGSVGRDTFSNSLLKFKRGEHPDLEGWIDCTLEQSAALPIREETIILRALHHHEPAVDLVRPASLDLLGEALAERFKCRYLPGLLHKSHPVAEIKRLTREQREIALHEAYVFTAPAPNDPAVTHSRPDRNDPHNPHNPPGHSDLSTHRDIRDHSDPKDPPPHQLVLDDIVTTGSTMNAIIDAILSTHQATLTTDYSLLTTAHSPLTTDHSPLTSSPLGRRPSISTFSLAKADYDASFNLFHRLQGRNYLLEQGAQWLLAEEQETYGRDYSIETLKDWIRENSFP